MSMVSGTLWFILVLWNKNRLSKLMKTIVSEYYALEKLLKEFNLASIL